MLLKGYKNSIAAAIVSDRAVNLAEWHANASASIGRVPETPVKLADSMVLQGKGWLVRISASTPVNMRKCLVDDYSFSQQR